MLHVSNKQQLYLPQQFNYNGEGYWPPKISKELRRLGGQFTLGKYITKVGEKKKEKAHIQKNTQSTNIIIQQGLINCNLNTLHDWQYSTVKVISLKTHDSAEPQYKNIKFS